VVAYVALLRGVNVGGNKKAPAADLRALATALKYEGAVTLLNSGNLVFHGPKKATAAIEKEFEQAAKTTMDLETEFFVRTAAEWQALVDANPFPKEAKNDPGRLVLWTLKAPVPAAAAKALQAAIKGRESFRNGKNAVYLVYPDGQGTSKLSPAVIDRAFGIKGTGRNWNTALKLCALLKT
jgi:uncharacterized protein (DUF1697 family)